MINGAHFLLYSEDPEADRAFLRDVLDFRSVDAGRGWLIFALPPAEIAIHPSDEGFPRNTDEGVARTALYLLCDDVKSTMRSLERKKRASRQCKRHNGESLQLLLSRVVRRS